MAVVEGRGEEDMGAGVMGTQCGWCHGVFVHNRHAAPGSAHKKTSLELLGLPLGGYCSHPLTTICCLSDA